MNDFAGRLIAWHGQHGRHDLPWQRDRAPYRVWVSEIMLQQTQVATVIPYFERFVARFPDVHALAAAHLDEVLSLWSGLGYYARARHLHRTAQLIVAQHGGEIPADVDTLESLPGIGRSTAGAILALSLGAPQPILDGNVKRVLARHHGVAGWPGRPEVERELWTLARAHTPRIGVAAYTQAIMDLGATVCTRTRPRCQACPVRGSCFAFRTGAQENYPGRRPARAVPGRRATFVLLEDEAGRVLLERRPESGIWGGLWSFPECPAGTDVVDWAASRFGERPLACHGLPGLRHTFTHFHLDIEPVYCRVHPRDGAIAGDGGMRWVAPRDAMDLGLAAPVRRLIQLHFPVGGEEP